MRERAVAWRRVSRGLLFVGFGVFFLLTTLDVLPGSFWLEALSYWPVLLVALGLRIIFERSRVPWALLLSPVLILGTLTFVALSGPMASPTNWKSWRAERAGGVDRWTLDAHLAMAQVDVAARPLGEDLLLKGRSATSRKASVRVSEGSGRATVRVRGVQRRWVVGLPSRRNRWDLEVTPDLPLTLDVDAAFAHGDMDLELAPISRLDLDGAFNNLTFRLGEPEQDVRLAFEGAFNNIDLVVPPTTPVWIDTDGFLQWVDGRPGVDRLSGPGYRLRMEGAFNRLEIRSH